MTLTPEEKKAIIAYRKERAFKTMQEAKDVAQLGHWNLVANRLYYASFYAQIAALMAKGLSASTHAGVKHLISFHFVKEGILSLEEGRFLGLLFSNRQTGDYEDNYDWDEAEITPLIPKTEQIINKLLLTIPEALQ